MIIIATGVIIVFVISGFQARILFAPSITEDAKVTIKNEEGIYIVEGSDSVPRSISDCPYNTGDRLSIIGCLECILARLRYTTERSYHVLRSDDISLQRRDSKED